MPDYSQSSLWEESRFPACSNSKWGQLTDRKTLVRLPCAQAAAPQGGKQATIVCMGLAIFAMRLLEVMFFAGLAGSAVVVAISFIEDTKELIGKDEK